MLNIYVLKKKKKKKNDPFSNPTECETFPLNDMTYDYHTIIILPMKVEN